MAKKKRKRNTESSLLAPTTGTFVGIRGLSAKQRRERAAVLKKYGIKEVKPKKK